LTPPIEVCANRFAYDYYSWGDAATAMLAAGYRVVKCAIASSKAASNFESYFSLGVERLKAPHPKFVHRYCCLSHHIPQAPGFSALFESRGRSLSVSVPPCSAEFGSNLG
jgi:hypothetical protein